jgi:hypothetical protein
MLVIKVLNEFSSSVKKLDELEDLLTFLETEYSALPRHGPTYLLIKFVAVGGLLKTGA